MAKRRREAEEITIENSPISEGLRRIILERSIGRRRSADEYGISKPRFYRFLKRERGLSQEALDDLASRLGVRIVAQGGPHGRTESRDSAAPTATEPEVGSAQARPNSTDPTSRVLADLEAAIDEEFADFESRLVGRMLVSGWEEPGVWERLRRWFEPPSRDDDGGTSISPGDSSAAGGSPADRILRRAPIADAAPTTPNGLLDALRISVKVRVHEALGDLATEMRAGGDVGRGTIPPSTATDPPGDPRAATIPRRSAAPPIVAGGAAGEDPKGVLGVPERIGPVDDGEEAGESEATAAPLVGGSRRAPLIRPSPVTPIETIFDDDDDQDDEDHNGEHDFEDEDEDALRSSPTFDPYVDDESEADAQPEPAPNSLAAQLAVLRQQTDDYSSLLDDEDLDVPPPADSNTSTPDPLDDDDDCAPSNLPPIRDVYEDPTDEPEAEKPSPGSLAAQIAAMSAKHAHFRRTIYDDDDEDEACSNHPPAMAPEGGEEEKESSPPSSGHEADTEEDDGWADMYRRLELRKLNPPRSDRSYVQHGEFSRDEIDDLLERIDNPEVHRLAGRYTKPGRRAVERAKFYCFFAQVRFVNPQGAAILARIDIYEKYLQVARRLYDHGHMRSLGNTIEAGDLALEGEALTERLQQHLASVGIHDGIHGSYIKKPAPNPGTASRPIGDLGLCRPRSDPRPKP